MPCNEWKNSHSRFKTYLALSVGYFLCRCRHGTQTHKPRDTGKEMTKETERDYYLTSKGSFWDNNSYDEALFWGADRLWSWDILEMTTPTSKRSLWLIFHGNFVSGLKIWLKLNLSILILNLAERLTKTAVKLMQFLIIMSIFNYYYYYYYKLLWQTGMADTVCSACTLQILNLKIRSIWKRRKQTAAAVLHMCSHMFLLCLHCNQWCHSRWQLKENTCCDFTGWAGNLLPSPLPSRFLSATLWFSPLSPCFQLLCMTFSRETICRQPYNKRYLTVSDALHVCCWTQQQYI